MIVCVVAHGAQASARVPDWVQSHASISVPASDPQPDSVVLYSDTQVSVSSDGTVRRLLRQVYRILRPDGLAQAKFAGYVNPSVRLIGMHGWSIGLHGETQEVSQHDAIESSMPNSDEELYNDLRVKTLVVPGVSVGGVVATELEEETKSLQLGDGWSIRDTVPILEEHYEIELPKNWQLQATWIHHPEEPAVTATPGHWSWTLRDLKPVRLEPHMPPWQSAAGELIVSFTPPAGTDHRFQSWNEMGAWYTKLTHGHRDASKDIRQKVTELTEKESTPLGKIRRLADFVQKNVRYVAIELGIGGYEPHNAGDIFAHQYGDCKDKATLLSAMLKVIGIDSYYVVVNHERGMVTADTPAHLAFDHVILAVSLPPGADDSKLLAVANHAALGRLLFFDPTDPMLAFGRLEGALQGGYGLLVTDGGGELTRLPQLPAGANSIERVGKLTLDADGTLHGELHESWDGDLAEDERERLRDLVSDRGQEKVLKNRLAGDFSSFDVLSAALGNLRDNAAPLIWQYTIEAQRYAKSADDLLIVRPRIVSSDASAFLETAEPRENPVEFVSAQRRRDSFDIAMPTGYRVEELPAPVNLDFGYASYHSQTDLLGQTLRYSRSFEIMQLQVPLEKADELRKLFRVIRSDEDRSIVLVRSPQSRP